MELIKKKYLVVASTNHELIALVPTLAEAIEVVKKHHECVIWSCEREFSCHIIQGMLFID